MPRANVLVTSNVPQSFRTNSLGSMFDFTFDGHIERRFSADIDIEDRDWNIGLIHGSSGSGKSTLLRELFGKPREFKWNPKHSLVDDFPGRLSVSEISDALSSVGFSMPPRWMAPYAVLSEGERFRTALARAIMEDTGDGPVVIDEFTSTVNRMVAKAASRAVAKYVRRKGMQIVLAGCHDDIISWLQPDWRFDTDTSSFFLTSNPSDPVSNSKYSKYQRTSWHRNGTSIATTTI